MAVEQLNLQSVEATDKFVEADPTKDFFVNMITRDIGLEDAILDLLDNCTDGVHRLHLKHGSDIEGMSYEGYWAEIEIKPDRFSIIDNCGGIPVDIAQRVAFKMGRPVGAMKEDDELYTVGTYGIGMKRALFKMGRLCRVISQTETESFQVLIPPGWFDDNDTWRLPFKEIDPVLEEPGTRIDVTELKPDIKAEFTADLADRLYERISELFSYIIKKGFVVIVNGVEVKPVPLELRIGTKELIGKGPVIAPYAYRATLGEVSVELIVGFYRPIPTDAEIEDETKGKKYRSSRAGWTVICNDRVVLYSDKSAVTGWGVSKVPAFHSQFIAIAGVVFFRSKDASELPLTTTKRGIALDSQLYLKVRDQMIEGMRIFTSFTNAWKSNIQESKKVLEQTQSYGPREALTVLSQQLGDAGWTRVANRANELKFAPDLPLPQTTGPKSRKIIFSRPEAEIQTVANYFEDPDMDPSEVGGLCFDTILRMASK